MPCRVPLHERWHSGTQGTVVWLESELKEVSLLHSVVSLRIYIWHMCTVAHSHPLLMVMPYALPKPMQLDLHINHVKSLKFLNVQMMNRDLDLPAFMGATNKVNQFCLVRLWPQKHPCMCILTHTRNMCGWPDHGADCHHHLLTHLQWKGEWPSACHCMFAGNLSCVPTATAWSISRIRVSVMVVKSMT